MVITRGKDVFIFNIIGYFMIGVISILCLLPFLLILSGSITAEESIMHDGYRLIPKAFSLKAYETLFMYPGVVVKAYIVTILVTVAGTAAGVFFMAMGGYVLQRKDFKYRNLISFFIFFTTLFSGGLIPWYILIANYMNLKDKYAALILPYLMSAFLIILLKNYISSIPQSITESAKIDGAGDFSIFIRMILPLSKAGIATVALFLALNYWNDWFLGLTFIVSPQKYPLQTFLYSVLMRAQFLTQFIASRMTVVIDLPTESLKLATAVVVTGPIIFLYPFIQKYFVRGITIGALKG